MTEDEIAQVIAGVDAAVQHRIAQELEQVYAAIDRVRDELPEMYRPVEALREEFRATIEVMDGTDQAIIAKVLEIVDGLSSEGDTPVRLVGEMSEAWSRFVHAEAQRLGMIAVPGADGKNHSASELSEFMASPDAPVKGRVKGTVGGGFERFVKGGNEDA